jgi:hypothetical protein
MVTLRRLNSRRLAASSLRPRVRSTAKARPEPIAATTRKMPELSANEASRRPATSSKIFFPSIFLFTFQSCLSVSRGMLAPASDKTGRPVPGAWCSLREPARAEGISHE